MKESTSTEPKRAPTDALPTTPTDSRNRRPVPSALIFLALLGVFVLARSCGGMIRGFWDMSGAAQAEMASMRERARAMDRAIQAELPDVRHGFAGGSAEQVGGGDGLEAGMQRTLPSQPWVLIKEGVSIRTGDRELLQPFEDIFTPVSFDSPALRAIQNGGTVSSLGLPRDRGFGAFGGFDVLVVRAQLTPMGVATVEVPGTRGVLLARILAAVDPLIRDEPTSAPESNLVVLTLVDVQLNERVCKRAYFATPGHEQTAESAHSAWLASQAVKCV